jgi:outer membrane lipoprotein SlyB
MPKKALILESRIMNRSLPLLMSAIMLSCASAGCAPKPTPNSFAAQESMRAVTVRLGTVESVRGVEIRAGTTRLGAVTGAVIGGALGSTIGSNTAGNVAGAAGGAAAGGAIGNAAGRGRATPGVEITIKLDDDSMIAVVQPGDPRDFRPGDRVRISGEGQNVRVTR